MIPDSYQENSAEVSKDTTFGICGHIFKYAAFVILVLSVWFSEALVFLLLWRWFLVPLGIPNISYVHAFGIYILWSFIKTPTYKKTRSEESFGFRYWKGYLFHSYIVILIVLALAWPIYLILQNQ